VADINHILCATDFSGGSDLACDHAAKLAKEYGAKFTMFHVIEHFPEDRSNEIIAHEDVDPKADHEEKAMVALTQQASRLDCQDAQLSVTFSTHAAAYEIVRYAADEKADLIVIATHEHKGLNALLGNTAEYVKKHANCEVVVVPKN
jgi:nucleotide-binding universal stress UspA family protein